MRCIRAMPNKQKNEAASARPFAEAALNGGPPANKKGSGAPKGALSNQCPRQARLRAAGRAARRPSALTLAALATGSTRWLSPRTGFPAAFANGGFARFALRTLPRLSTLRADRSLCRSTGDPGPPGCGLAIPRAGTASRLRCYGLPSGTAPSNERDKRPYCHRCGEVKGV
jgi:hypothetical protein